MKRSFWLLGKIGRGKVKYREITKRQVLEEEKVSNIKT